jgi:hypothetical protein
MRRTIGTINRQIWKDIVPRLIEAGCRRVEARPIKSYERARLWISIMGGIPIPSDLGDHGRNGEVFELWAWTLTDYLRSNPDGVQASQTAADP